MAFFTRKEIGRLYVLRILVDGCIVHKIGMVNTDRSTDRMMEILRSWFVAYRYVPLTVMKLDMKCDDPHKLEKHIHKILKNNQYLPDKKVSGGTEMFKNVDEVKVIAFLKAYNNSMCVNPDQLTEKEYGVICRLLSL